MIGILAAKGSVGLGQTANVATATNDSSAGQNLSVKTGKNEMDNETWVRLQLRADQPYMSKSGAEILPLIEIQCSTSPALSSIEVFFYTGIIKGDSPFDSPLRIKFGELGPFYVLYSVLPDIETLHYMQSGTENGPMLNLSESGFVAALTARKTALVEFTPYLWSGTVTAKFDTTTLMPELAKHQECMSAFAKK
jgi:hypothetical protein